MLYRDFMQKYRPVFAPDGPAAGGGTEAAAAAAGDSGPAAAPTPAASDGGATDAGGAAAAAPAADVALSAGDVAPAASGLAASPAGEPTLLEAAEGKKPAAETPAGENKDQPAPTEAAKPDGDKKPDGDVKEKGEGDKPKPESDKPAAETDPAKKDATAEAQPPAPIKYDAFKLPDGVKLDEERLSKFTEVAGKGQVTQEVAQDLVNLHIEEMQRLEKDIQQRATQNQQDVWKALNDGWKAELRKDERLGGNRIETNLSMAKAVLEEYGGTPEQVRDLLAHTKANGMGNYPGFIRLLVNIGEALNVFEEGSVAGDTRPPKAAGSRAERWYANSKMGNGSQP